MTNVQQRKIAAAAGERFFTPVKPCRNCNTSKYYVSTGETGACVQCTKQRVIAADKRPRKTDKRIATQRMTACTKCQHEQHKPRAMGGDHSLTCAMCGHIFDSSEHTWLQDKVGHAS